MSNVPRTLSGIVLAHDALVQGLAFFRDNGDILERTISGHWVKPGVARFEPGMPHLPAPHLYALKRVGYVTIQWFGQHARAQLTRDGLRAADFLVPQD